ncbi:MAG: hypothetical protein H6708_01100 [Kofleriaceae bacterium]|nr:hypothetical protein [Kofleriaceae bacterium]
MKPSSRIRPARPARAHVARGLGAAGVAVAVAWAAAGCVFDPTGAALGGGVGDGGVIGDDQPIPDGAVDPVCGCALGCGDDGVTCLAFDPSNLDDLTALDGVTTDLVLAGGTYLLDTSAQQLADPDGVVVDGLRFVPLDDGGPGLLVLAVARLEIAADATLRAVGDRALLLLSRDQITVAGTIDVAGGCEVDPATPGRDRVWCGGPGAGDGGHRDGGNGRTGATGCAPAAAATLARPRPSTAAAAAASAPPAATAAASTASAATARAAAAAAPTPWSRCRAARAAGSPATAPTAATTTAPPAAAAAAGCS